MRERGINRLFRDAIIRLRINSILDDPTRNIQI